MWACEETDGCVTRLWGECVSWWGSCSQKTFVRWPSSPFSPRDQPRGSSRLLWATAACGGPCVSLTSCASCLGLQGPREAAAGMLVVYGAWPLAQGIAKQAASPSGHLVEAGGFAGLGTGGRERWNTRLVAMWLITCRSWEGTLLSLLWSPQCRFTELSKQLGDRGEQLSSCYFSETFFPYYCWGRTSSYISQAESANALSHVAIAFLVSDACLNADWGSVSEKSKEGYCHDCTWTWN